MIVAPYLNHFGMFAALEVAEVGNTYKPTVYAEAVGPYDHEDLPSEPLGTFALTLTNVIPGSSIRVETQAGTLIEQRTATSSTEVFSVPAYGVGNANNNLRIKVRKGTAAPKYQPFETLATAFVGSASVYIAQVPDPIA